MRYLQKIILLGLVTIAFSAAGASAQVSATITHQGYLADNSGTPLSGPVQMAFALYGVESAGTPLWTETQTVQVTSGIFAVPLGAVTPIDAAVIDDNLWLGVTLGSDSEMTPRQKLTSVAYSLRAFEADTVPDGAITNNKIAGPISAAKVPELQNRITALEAELVSLQMPILSSPTVETVVGSTGEFVVDMCDDVERFGDSVAFTWSVISQPTDSNVTVTGSGCAGTFTPDVTGEYVIEVSADNNGLISTQQVAFQHAADLVVEGSGYARSPVAVATSDGGAIVAWHFLAGNKYEIKAQKVDALGKTLWGPTEKLLVSKTNYVAAPNIVEDGQGGALIFWREQVLSSGYNRNGIRGLRVGPNAQFLWPAEFSRNDIKQFSGVFSDGGGGAILAWEETISSTGEEVFIARVNRDGFVLWTKSLEKVSIPNFGSKKVINVEIDPLGRYWVWWGGGGMDFRVFNADGSMAADSPSGSILVPATLVSNNQYIEFNWESGSRLRASKHDMANQEIWSAYLTPSIASSGNGAPYAIADGLGGAFISWSDLRNGDSDVFVQHLDTNGKSIWHGIEGISVTAGRDGTESHSMLVWPDQGTLVVWEDLQNGFKDIRYQIIDDSGTSRYSSTGKSLVQFFDNQTLTDVILNQNNNVLVFFKDDQDNSLHVKPIFY